MQIWVNYFILGIGVLLMLSVIASKFSDRFGVPSLLIFLGIGMLAGSDGLGGIYFDDPALAQNIGIAALIVILFSGGLDTEWKSIRPIMKEGGILATLGVFLTAVILGYAAHRLLGITLLEGMLLGAITSSTDAAAVFAILRSKGIRLKGNLKPMLEFESGSNDPMAVFLTVGLIQLVLNPNQSPLELVPMFFQQMLIGAAAGYLTGKILLFLINRLRLGYDGLYPVLVFGMILLGFSAANLVGGSGFLAVYIAGLILGKEDFLHKHSLIRFYDGLAWLMHITMFVTLGLLVFPSQLVTIIVPGLILSFVLMFIARPIASFIGLAFSKFSLKEKTFISWVGLRGSVPVILATYPTMSNVPEGQLYFNFIFFIVLTSVLIQGTSIPIVSRWLGVDDKEALNSPKYPVEFVPGDGVDPKWKLREVTVPEHSWAIGKAIYELGLPEKYLVILISRNDRFIIPNGSVVLRSNDRLLGLSDEDGYREVRALLTRPVETKQVEKQIAK